MTPSNFRRPFVPTALGMLSILAAGCNQTSTRYYFAAASLDSPSASGGKTGPGGVPTDPPLTLYRVTVTASSFGVKSSLQQGFYDADALHQLFGEVKQNSGTKTPAADSSAAATDKVRAGTFEVSYDPKTGRWSATQDSLYTILYGANADAMAQQINSLAGNKKFVDSVAKMLGLQVAGAPTGAADEQLSKTLLDEQLTARDLAGELDTLAATIDDAATPKAVRAKLYTAAQDSLRSVQGDGKGKTTDSSAPAMSGHDNQADGAAPGTSPTTPPAPSTTAPQ